MSSRGSITLVYGPKVITDDKVLDAIAAAIDNHLDFTISNANLGGDPAVGVEKQALIFYNTGPGTANRNRTAPEWDPKGGAGKLIFSKDIKSVVYGNTFIADPQLYTRLYKALIGAQSYDISNTSIGVDPLKGTGKTATVVYYNGTGPAIEVFAQEGGKIQFK